MHTWRINLEFEVGKTSHQLGSQLVKGSNSGKFLHRYSIIITLHQQISNITICTENVLFQWAKASHLTFYLWAFSNRGGQLRWAHPQKYPYPMFLLYVGFTLHALGSCTDITYLIIVLYTLDQTRIFSYENPITPAIGPPHVWIFVTRIKACPYCWWQNIIYRLYCRFCGF